MDKVFKELKDEKVHLRHTEIAHDASVPHIEPGTAPGKFDKDALLQGIEKGVPLKHVETVDKAKPAIEPGTHIGTNSHNQLLSEIKEKVKPAE